MTVNKRERIIAIATGAVIGLFLLDWLLITPWLEARGDLETREAVASEELDRAERVFSNDRRASRRWAELSEGRLAADGPAAEGQLLNGLRDWAQESGLTLTSVRPDRTDATHGFRRVTVRATATGQTRPVAEFLWRLQTTPLPVRLDELQATSREPGQDALTLQFAVSTIYLPQAGDGGEATR